MDPTKKNQGLQPAAPPSHPLAEAGRWVGEKGVWMAESPKTVAIATLAWAALLCAIWLIA